MAKNIIDISDFSDGVQVKTTVGNFETEPDACEYFDAEIEATGLWNIEREVVGYNLFQLATKSEQRTFRIDRMLWPKTALVEKHGWTAGPVGIEIKKSAVKIGRPISQCLDYCKSVFVHKPDGLNVQFMPRYVFIYPLDEVHGNTASIMAQNGVGCAMIRKYKDQTRINFKYANQNAFSYYKDAEKTEVFCNQISAGAKQGSR